MKYIDADKLIAEIERQQRKLILLANTEQVDVRRDCALQNGVYDYILGIITSLQQEQPEVDLEKEISDTCRSYRIRGDFDGTELNKHDIENIARHFYELGLNARKEK